MGSREKIDAYVDSPDYLFVGARARGLKVLIPSVTTAVARGPDGAELTQESWLYASSCPDVAIFAGAVWGRNGWSGWHSYEGPTRPTHEFFAAPFVLKQAVLRQHEEGSVYRVKRNPSFRPHVTPGEFVSTEPVIPEEEYPVTLWDMRWDIAITPHLVRAGSYVGSYLPRPTPTYGPNPDGLPFTEEELLAIPSFEPLNPVPEGFQSARDWLEHDARHAFRLNKVERNLLAGEGW